MAVDRVVNIATGQVSDVAISDADAAARVADTRTNAQKAAPITLSRVQFLGALATALSQPPETVADYIKAQITAAEGAAQISSSDASLARFFIDNAGEFPRVDPNPAEAALLVVVGAILGLDEDAIDALFIAAA